MRTADLALVYWFASRAAHRGQPLARAIGMLRLTDLARFPSGQCPRVAELARRTLDNEPTSAPALDTLPDGAA